MTDPGGATVTGIEFGDAAIGQDHAVTLRVTDTGAAAVGPLAISITGAAANEFVLDNVSTTCAGATLEPATSCDLVVTFRPTTVGGRAATLTIAHPDGAIAVALAGNGFMPALHFDPPVVDVGRVELGKATQVSLELHNDGPADAPIDGFAATGAGYDIVSTSCVSTLPVGGSCDVVVTASPPGLGAASGQITVTSQGVGYSATAIVHGARRITVVRSGNGSGTVTSDPVGIACGTSCTGLFEGEVVLAAAPSANEVVSWSIASCGQGTTCTIAAEPSPVTVTASFTLQGTSELTLTLASGPGEVRVVDIDQFVTLATCVASCTLPVDAGVHVGIEASTFVGFAGFSPSCPNASGATCSFTMPSSPLAITAMFEQDPHEVWARLPGGLPIHTAAFDSSNHLIVGQEDLLTKLSPLGATEWSRAMSVVAVATGPSESIYVVTPNELVRLDTDGARAWSTQLVDEAKGCPGDRFTSFIHCIAVGSDGAVVVHGTTGIAKWTATGALAWRRALPNQAHYAVAIDGELRVHVATEAANAEDTNDSTFDPDGAVLGTTFAIAQPNSMFATDVTGAVLAASSGHGDVILETPGFSRRLDVLAAAAVSSGVAGAGDGAIAWLYELDDFNVHAASWQLDRHAPDGSLVTTLVRPRQVHGDDETGTVPLDVVASPDGHLAVVGSYNGLAYHGAWIQTYAP